MKVNAVYMIHP